MYFRSFLLIKRNVSMFVVLLLMHAGVGILIDIGSSAALASLVMLVVTAYFTQVLAFFGRDAFTGRNSPSAAALLKLMRSSTSNHLPCF